MDSDSSINRDQPYNVVCGAMPRCQPAPSQALGMIYPVEWEPAPHSPSPSKSPPTHYLPLQRLPTARVARTGTGKAPTAEQRFRWTLGTGHWALDTGHWTLHTRQTHPCLVFFHSIFAPLGIRPSLFRTSTISLVGNYTLARLASNNNQPQNSHPPSTYQSTTLQKP